MTASIIPGENTLRAMLAAAAYRSDNVRTTGASLDGADCLVASRQGLFAVGRDGSFVKAAHGFFFGLRAFDDGVLLFEACDRVHVRGNRGRLVHLAWEGRVLGRPSVLAKGLDNQCHQVAWFDGSLWVVDTADQAILQFASDGAPIATHRPFPPADPTDTSGAYLHLNSIAKIGDRIAVMLHNGRADPLRPSDLAWLDPACRLLGRVPLAGHRCHDIVVDDAGILWHCDSMAGDIISSAGDRIHVTHRMTRGLAVTAHTIIVGASDMATRAVRDEALGSVTFLDRAGGGRIDIPLPGAPTDLIPL